MELAAFPGKPLPKPPGHLKAAGRRLWTDIITQYRIADGAGLALVTTAAEALDRTREAQAAIRKHGALVADRYGGVKQNPACFLERDARAGMLSALRALNLDPGAVARPRPLDGVRAVTCPPSAPGESARR